MKTRLNDFGRQMAQCFVIRRPREGHYAAVVGRDRRTVEADIGEVMAELAVAVEGFVLLQEADAVLRDKDPTRIQTALAAFVECRGEQTLAGTD